MDKNKEEHKAGIESTNSNDPARIDHTFDNKKEDDQLQKDTHARIDFCNVDEGSASNEFTESLNDATEHFKNETTIQRGNITHEIGNFRNNDNLIKSLKLGNNYLSSRTNLVNSTSRSGRNGNKLLRRETKESKKKYSKRAVVPFKGYKDHFKNTMTDINGKHPLTSSVTTECLYPRIEINKIDTNISKVGSEQDIDTMQGLSSNNLGVEKEVRVNISGNHSPRVDLSHVNQELTPSRVVRKKRTSKRIGEIMNNARRRESMDEESSNNPNLFERSFSEMENQEKDAKSERRVDTFMDLLDKRHKKIEKKKITPKPKVMSKSSRSQAPEQYSSESSESNSDTNEDGDKTFREKLRSLNFQNCNEIAAQYFKLAYRGVRILHFHNGTFAQKSYFMATSPFVRELKMYMCWLYMFLTFFEPNNSRDTQIHRQSIQFR